MKFKKLTALMMVTLLAASSLAGCGEKSENESKEASASQKETEKEQESESAATEESEESGKFTFPLDETMKFTLFRVGRDDVEYTYNENPVWLAREEATNVHFDQMEAMQAEATEKGNLLISSGEYPDVFYGSVVDTALYGGPNGVLLPLEDLIREYAPNLTAVLDEKNAWDKIANPVDGHIYNLPQIGVDAFWNIQTFVYNEVWLDKLGLGVPDSYEEFYEALKAIKEKDPNGNGEADEVPLQIASDGLFSIFGLTPFLITDGLVLPTERVMIVDGEMQFLPTSDAFKEFLVEATKWYSEGLINKDCFTLKWNENYSVLAGANNIGFALCHWASMGDWRNQYNRFAPISGSPGLAGTLGIDSSGTCITDNCKNPEVVVAFFDYFYSEEGAMEAGYGQKGVDWQLDEDGKLEVIDDHERSYLTFAGSSPYNAASTAKYLTTVIRELNGEWLISDAEFNEEVGTDFPTVNWGGDYLDTFVDIEAALSPYVTNYVANVVIGEISLEDTWEDFKAEVEAMGVCDYLAAFNTACGEAFTVAE